MASGGAIRAVHSASRLPTRRAGRRSRSAKTLAWRSVGSLAAAELLSDRPQRPTPPGGRQLAALPGRAGRLPIPAPVKGGGGGEA